MHIRVHLVRFAVAAAAFSLWLTSPAQAQFDIGGLIRGGIEKSIRQETQKEQDTRGTPGAARTTVANRFALIVAVQECPEASLETLTGINDDARALRAALENGGFPTENVTLLSTESEDESLVPTRANILASVQAVTEKAGKSDLVVVFTIGHGVTLKGVNYFCPSDCKPAGLVNPDVAPEQLVPVTEIVDPLAASDTRCKMLVIDACRSQSANRSAAPAQELTGKHDGVWIVTSCSQGEKAWVSPEIRAGESHAIYTHFLTEGLTGEADLASGNNNGRITLFEAHTYARERTRNAAQAIGEKQTPHLYFATNLFDFVEISTLLPNRILRSGDPEVDANRTALVLGDLGNSVCRNTEIHSRTEFRKQKPDAEGVLEVTLQDQHNQLCYAFGTYLTPAIELDPNCRPARLARAFSYRAAGEYKAALDEYQQVGEPLRVFASGSLATRDDLFEKEDWGNYRFLEMNDEQLKDFFSTIKLQKEPTADAPTVGVVRSIMHLSVTEVREENVDGTTRQWLYVTAADGNKLETPGWLTDRQVHWAPEAAELYVPDSEDINGDRIPAMISAQRKVAEHTAQQQGLIQAVRDLRVAEQTLARLAQFGLPVGQAQQIVSIIRAALQIAAVAGRQTYVQTYTDYRESVNGAQLLMEKRRRLLEQKGLEPVEDRTIEIQASPWSLASGSGEAAD